MAKTIKCPRQQRSYTTMIKYYGGKGKQELAVRTKCVRCQGCSALYVSWVVGKAEREEHTDTN